MIGEKICYAAGFCAEALIVWMYLEYLCCLLSCQLLSYKDKLSVRQKNNTLSRRILMLHNGNSGNPYCVDV